MSVTAGERYSCAVLNTGQVACWGSNFYGQLGSATNSGTDAANPVPSPVGLPAGTSAVAVTAGGDHTCAVLNTGQVACWGQNIAGQLGSTTNEDRTANRVPSVVGLPAGTRRWR